MPSINVNHDLADRSLFLAWSGHLGSDAERETCFDNVRIPQICEGVGVSGVQSFLPDPVKPLPGTGVVDFGHVAWYELSGQPGQFPGRSETHLVSDGKSVPEGIGNPGRALFLSAAGPALETPEADHFDLAERHLFFAWAGYTGAYETFAHWYDTVHLPDLLGVPGVVRAQRFLPETVTPVPGVVVPDLGHVAVYEVRGSLVPVRDALKDQLLAGRLQLSDQMNGSNKVMFLRPASPYLSADGR
ncbi:MAG: hypothetical protein AAGC80_27945 [Rhodococcus sp. (in: high G+C Gram-positive bacteria)]